LNYEFGKFAILREPLLLFGGFFSLFLFFIFVSRIKIRIGHTKSEDKTTSKHLIRKFIEKANKCNEYHDELDTIAARSKKERYTSSHIRKQNKTKQNKTKQNKTKQNKTKQKTIHSFSHFTHRNAMSFTDGKTRCFSNIRNLLSEIVSLSGHLKSSDVQSASLCQLLVRKEEERMKLQETLLNAEIKGSDDKKTNAAERQYADIVAEIDEIIDEADID